MEIVVTVIKCRMYIQISGKMVLNDRYNWLIFPNCGERLTIGRDRHKQHFATKVLQKMQTVHTINNKRVAGLLVDHINGCSKVHVFICRRTDSHKRTFHFTAQQVS